MPDWLKIILIIVGVLLLFVLFCYAVTSPSKQRTQLCKDAGYLDVGFVNNAYVCYGYVEGNQMVVESIEQVKARMEHD
jgi:hypothetical protein